MVRVAFGAVLGLASGMLLGLLLHKLKHPGLIPWPLPLLAYEGAILGLALGLALGATAGLAGAAGFMAAKLGRDWGRILGHENPLVAPLPLGELRERLSSLNAIPGGADKSEGALHRWILVRVLRALVSALENLKAGKTTGGEFERVLRQGAEEAMWKALKRPIGFAVSMTLAVFGILFLMTGCGGAAKRPDWVKPGLVGVDWPALEGETSRLIGWQAREVATSVRENILVVAPGLFGMEVVPMAAGGHYAFILKPSVWKWTAAPPGGEKETPHNLIPEHEYGLSVILTDGDGRLLWQKSRSKTVPSKKGKTYIPIERAAGPAVKKLLKDCPLVRPDAEPDPETESGGRTGS